MITHRHHFTALFQGHLDETVQVLETNSGI